MGALEMNTSTEKEISETSDEKQQEEVEENKQKIVEDKKKKTEANMFQRVKNRFSTRSKKQEKEDNLKNTREKAKNEKQLEKKGLEELSAKDIESKLVTGTGDKESINRENKEEGKENANTNNEESLVDQNNQKRDDNVFVRVKERLSKRSKRKKTEKENKQHEKDQEKIPEQEKEIKKETKPDSQAESGETDACIVEKNNTNKKGEDENIFQKLMKRLSFRSKKKKKAEAPEKNTECEIEDKKDKGINEDDTKSLSSVDEELSALCKDNTEDNQETSPSVPIVSSSRPPLPSMRRPPSSATTAQSRPVSQLDAALKQFRLSTAASRENLRSSKVDISQVEEQVKTMVTSRPSTPTPAGWRSRAPAENKNLTDQWAKLSSSMTDLR